MKTAKAAPADAGDIWTWTGIDADSRLIVSYLVRDRSRSAAIDLMDDLRSRHSNRVQISTDGHRAYLEAVAGAFGGDMDYAQVVSSTVPRRPAPAVIAPPNAPGSRRSALKAIPTKGTSQLRSWKPTTRPCGCTCAGSPA